MSSSSRVLHGDLLRCIIEFIESHSELFRFALVNRDLQIQIYKLIGTLSSGSTATSISIPSSRLPCHLRYYRYFSVAGFKNLLVPTTAMPPIAWLTSLDLTRLTLGDSDECFPLDLVSDATSTGSNSESSSPPSTSLARFSSLTSLHCHHRHDPDRSHVVDDPDHSLSIDDMNDYRDYLIELITKHCHPDKLTHLRIEVDPSSEIDEILQSMTHLTSLQLDIFMWSNIGISVFHKYMDSLNSSNLPHLKVLQLNCDTPCTFPIIYKGVERSLMTMMHSHVLRGFRASTTTETVRVMPHILFRTFTLYQSDSYASSLEHLLSMMRLLVSDTPPVSLPSNFSSFMPIPQSCLTLTRIQFDLTRNNQQRSAAHNKLLEKQSQKEFSTLFDRLCQLQMSVDQISPPLLVIQCSIHYTRTFSTTTKESSTCVTEALETVQSTSSVYTDSDLSLNHFFGDPRTSIAFLLSRCNRLDLEYALFDTREETSLIYDPTESAVAAGPPSSSSSSSSSSPPPPVGTAVSLFSLLTEGVMPCLSEIHISAKASRWPSPKDTPKEELDCMTQEIAQMLRRQLAEHREGNEAQQQQRQKVRVVALYVSQVVKVEHYA